jgi:cytochrome c551/c552
MKKIIGITALVLIGLFLAIQLIPYGHQHQNPPVQQEPAWPDAQTRDLAVRACFDCHSNETVWPWYSNIAPVSWLVEYDVQEGRSRLNFSEWDRTGRERYEIGEISEVIHQGVMPPAIFLIMHPKARLSTAEKQTLINGLLATSQAAVH